ncbi:MAG: hypothetical protein O8C67_02020 [Candidatus Methanoperedens sp.]|nr:hypothetical protein [Candidatus Methanoperedens sp.]
MNQSRAKKIRKQIYGDASFRQTRYGIIERVKKFLSINKDGKQEKKNKITGQLVCVGLRAKYKQAKRAWKEEKG